MILRKPFACLFWLLTGALAPAQNGGLEDLFGQGNAYYADEQYAEAANAYQEAYRTTGKSSLALWFNLGNAYYHLRDYPAALLAYEKALTLEPGNPDVLANLQKIVSQSGLERPQYNIAQEFAYTLAVNTWLLLLVIGSAVTTAAGLLAWYVPRLNPIPGLSLYLSVPVMLLAVLGLLLWKQDFSRALVLTPDTGLRVAPTESANHLGTLANGTWVEVLEFHDPYYYIRTPDKQEGWVKGSTIGKVWDN